MSSLNAQFDLATASFEVAGFYYGYGFYGFRYAG
ncbi:hypothetical protein FHS64_001463 [Brevundimonas terrae]|nr:hypothetical protein [Brevundimonas terrae]